MEHLAGWILWEPTALEMQLTLQVVLEVHNEDPGEKSPSQLGSF
jgi:hypothetical protein